MFSLKLATEQDALAVAVFLAELYRSSVYSKVTEYNPEDVADVIKKTARDPKTGVTILLYAEDKLIGAMICSSMQQLFNKAEKTAVELAFWITPDYRSPKTMKKMLKAYRYWAKRIGCTSILQGKLTDRNVTETYSIRKI